MMLLGKKYQHLVHGTGCSCYSPILQQASRRLDEFSRRSFLAGLGATAIAGAMPARAFAQASAPAPKTLFTKVRLFDGKSDTLQSGVQILIEGNRIASIDHDEQRTAGGRHRHRLRRSCPDAGMIDAHWHAVFAAVPLPVLTVR